MSIDWREWLPLAWPPGASPTPPNVYPEEDPCSSQKCLLTFPRGKHPLGIWSTQTPSLGLDVLGQGPHVSAQRRGRPIAVAGGEDEEADRWKLCLSRGLFSSFSFLVLLIPLLPPLLLKSVFNYLSGTQTHHLHMNNEVSQIRPRGPFELPSILFSKRFLWGRPQVLTFAGIVPS